MASYTGPLGSWVIRCSVLPSGANKTTLDSLGHSSTRFLSACYPSGQIPKKRFWNDGEFFVFVGVVDIFLTDTLRVMHETVLLHTLRDEICDEKSVQDLAERELELDNMLIKLILRACQSKQQGRALDFARLLCGSSAFDAAVRHAQNFGLNTLQKAIERLKVGHTGPSLELGANAASSGKRLADRGDDMVRKSSRREYLYYLLAT